VKVKRHLDAVKEHGSMGSMLALEIPDKSDIHVGANRRVTPIDPDFIWSVVGGLSITTIRDLSKVASK
jgi:hypothetical protein